MEQNGVTIDDMNEAIAIFDGWEFKKGDPNHKCPYCIGGDQPCTPAVDRFYKWGHIRFHTDLKYHTSWDALMPVWEKAGKTLYSIRRQVDETKYLEAYIITRAFLNACQKVDVHSAHASVHKAVQFITQQTTTNEQ